jgi:hypothetical protein
MDNYSPRTKMMINKLADQSARGNIKDEWTEDFIWDIKKKFDAGYPLTVKQLKKLGELFERN